jgi:hypothetical protein
MRDRPCIDIEGLPLIEYGRPMCTLMCTKSWRGLHGRYGLDHGVGHPGSIGLPYGSSLRTEGSWRYLHRFQDGGKHRAGFLRRDDSLRLMGMGLSPARPPRQQGHDLLV